MTMATQLVNDVHFSLHWQS